MDWAFLVALGALLLALAIYGWHAKRSSPVNRWFALQTLCLAGWITGVGGTHSGHFTEFWGRWTFAWASVMPASFLGFTRVFPETSTRPSALVVRLVTLLGVLLSTLSVATPWIAHNFILTPSGLKRGIGPLFPLFAVYFVSCALAVLALLVQKWRQARGQVKAQLQYYVAGLAILTICGIGTNLIVPLIVGSSEYSSVGPFFVLPMVALIGHAIIRHRLFDLRLVLGRGVSFALFIGAIATMIVLIGRSLGLSAATHSIAVPPGLAITIIVAAVSLSLPVAPFISRAIDAYLLRGRPDLDRALRDASLRLSRLLTEEEIIAQLSDVLASTLAPEFIRFINESGDNAHSDEVVHTVWSLEIPSPSVALVRAGMMSAESEAMLRSAQVEIVVSLGRSGQRSALIMLGPRRDGQAYLAPALRFLEDLADVSSLALEVAHLHRRHIELERERQRLANLARMGRLYAGLGHEIRTPLTTISNLVSLLPDRLDDPEFRDVMIRLIPAEVRRIVELAERLRALAPDARLVREPLALERIVEDLVAIVAPVAGTRGVTVTVEGPAQLPHIYGDSKRLTQLLHNLLNNALDAMPNGGRIEIQLSAYQDHVMVRVTDDGEGISADVQESLFEAFVTTKASGLGLGLSICQEVAREHGAQLTLKNRNDRRGAIAEVVFPILGPHSHSAISSMTEDPIRETQEAST